MGVTLSNIAPNADADIAYGHHFLVDQHKPNKPPHRRVYSQAYYLLAHYNMFKLLLATYTSYYKYKLRIFLHWQNFSNGNGTTQMSTSCVKGKRQLRRIPAAAPSTENRQTYIYTQETCKIIYL